MPIKEALRSRIKTRPNFANYVSSTPRHIILTSSFNAGTLDAGENMVGQAGWDDVQVT